MVFTNGEMVVHIVRLSTNLYLITDTMLEALIESVCISAACILCREFTFDTSIFLLQGMPYAIAKNIRDNIPKRCDIHDHTTNSHSL